MNKTKGFSLNDIIILFFLIIFLGIIFYGFYLNNKNNKEADINAKNEIQKIQTSLENYYVENESYPSDKDWQKSLTEDQNNTFNLENYKYDANGSGTNCYSLSYTLLNTKDSGPNINSGVYVLECKQ